eukprot:TRINITY_DN4977_c0_g1_i1.p1 TRINITY_DN4977_c0_g1~~TRINITY_DN4977_c0_g1_i1.p1  ORF type:complete len:370 (+),score=83.31 TRINITY_DN4977_c0_g1_i1:115-1224(+)
MRSLWLLLLLAWQAVCAPRHRAAKSSPERVVVVYRTTGDISPCAVWMIKRVAAIVDGQATVVVSYDPTLKVMKTGLPRAVVDARARAAVAPLPFYSISVDDVVSEFPGVRWGDAMPCSSADDMSLTVKEVCGHRMGWLIEEIHERFNVTDNRPLLNFWIHEPSTAILAKRLSTEKGGLRQLWMMEDDIAIGNSTNTIPRFLQHFKNRDFVSFHYHKKMDEKWYQKGDSVWWSWAALATRRFKELVPMVSRKAEHIDGYSQRFLRAMYRLIKEGGVAFGEVFGSSLCRHGSKALGFDCIPGDLRKELWATDECYPYANHTRTCTAHRKFMCSSDTKWRLDRCKSKSPSQAETWMHKVPMCQLMMESKSRR